MDRGILTVKFCSFKYIAESAIKSPTNARIPRMTFSSAKRRAMAAPSSPIRRTRMPTAPGSPSARPALSRSSRCTARLSRRTRRPPRRSSPRYGIGSSRCLISKLVGDCASLRGG